jgi:hypothetical protein
MPIPGTKWVFAICGTASRASAPIGFGLLSARWLSKGAKRQILTRLPNRTLHARPGGPVSRPLFVLVPHREDSDVAQAGPSTDDNFYGSKAGATFRLAMISIGTRLKPRARGCYYWTNN